MIIYKGEQKLDAPNLGFPLDSPYAEFQRLRGRLIVIRGAGVVRRNRPGGVKPAVRQTRL